MKYDVECYKCNNFEHLAKDSRLGSSSKEFSQNQNEQIWKRKTEKCVIALKAQMIQVDIDGHPPIPFSHAPSIHAAFHFHHNLLFLACFRVLHSRSRFGALMIQVDIGGHPPIPFQPPPSVLSVFKL